MGRESQQFRVNGLVIRFAIFLGIFGSLVEAQPVPAFVYTEAARYDAGRKNGERFPKGAALQMVSDGRKRALVPGFAASADAAVSFDGLRLLFSGKQKPGDPWQVWEMPLAGGVPRKLTTFPEDAITPFYLASQRIVYARRGPHGFQLETEPLDGGEVVRLTYTPGDHLACDVLRDGRILFEAPHPAAASGLRDLYTVYVDGSGVETYRCDHGRDRRGGRQVSSGDIVFETGGRLARFTSARAVQVDLAEVKGNFAGPVAEVSPGEWLVAYRPDAGQPYGIYRWKPGPQPPSRILEANGADAIQPVLVGTREIPKRHPSGLGDREGANLLCLNAYTSRERIPAESVSTVRVWALDDAGSAAVLGQAPVYGDGSFFVQTPSERAIRFELLDRAGRTVAAEKGWFWARRGEQRVCVGCHAGPERAPNNVAPEVLAHGTEPTPVGLPVHSANRGVK
jgi:hypothetical protein